MWLLWAQWSHWRSVLEQPIKPFYVWYVLILTYTLFSKNSKNISWYHQRSFFNILSILNKTGLKYVFYIFEWIYMYILYIKGPPKNQCQFKGTLYLYFPLTSGTVTKTIIVPCRTGVAVLPLDRFDCLCYCVTLVISTLTCITHRQRVVNILLAIVQFY